MPQMTRPDVTEALTDPVLGDDGYPTEQELQRIRDWPWDGPNGFRSLMAYIRPRWEHYGSFDQQGDRFRLATGGWSGNESIIGALEENEMFRMLCPVSWHHGGLYIYDVRTWDDNPEKGKRVLLRDPATPLDDHGYVYGCDHVAATPAPAAEPAVTEALRPGSRRFRDLLARERADVGMMAGNLARLYDSITGGRVSKPNTMASAVEQVVEERISDAYDEGYEDGKAAALAASPQSPEPTASPLAVEPCDCPGPKAGYHFAHLPTCHRREAEPFA